MGDFLTFLAQALGVFSRWLGDRSPVPWPLLLAALFPVFAGGLSVWIWWLRGSAWPLFCDYPLTVRKHPCRNVAVGEWRRCRVHNKRWRRRTDRHMIEARLRRWQTVDRSGTVVDRQGVVGRGFVRLSSHQSTLLYRRGFARPPGDVVRFLPTWYHAVRSQWSHLQEAWREVRTERWTWRRLLGVEKPPEVHQAVSGNLTEVIRATRIALGSFAVGLVSVGIAELLGTGGRTFLQYTAALLFVCTWAVTKEGIWAAEPRWSALAWRTTCRWAIPFFVFSVLGGSIVAVAPRG
jgi:hypothetical protein